MYLFQVSLIKTASIASNVFDGIKNYTRPVKETPKDNPTKIIELPAIVTASDLIQAQVNNKIPEPKIKRGIKRDHLTQQSMTSFVISTNISIIENEECVTKKPKIANTDSDMEISSDDDVQIIENITVDDTQHNCQPILIEESPTQEKTNDANQTLYYQTTSAIIRRPKIGIASNLFKNNYETSSSSHDPPSKSVINVDSDYIVTNNIPPTYQDKQINLASNNICTNSSKNVKDQENDLLLYPHHKFQTQDKEVNDIFNELSEILETSSDYEKNMTKQQNELPSSQKQKDLKQPSVEHKLQQNSEVPSTKSNLNNLFGEDSEDESKILMGDVKKKSLGVRLGMPSNVNNTLKTKTKSHESIKTIKNKTEDPNNKQKKFELSELVVNLLNPYYKNNVFKTKELFKFMAREIVHKLLESNSHPGKLMYFMQKYNLK